MALEFPKLGKHCAYSGCNEFDFLPLKCNLCSGVFCKNHGSRYQDHSCRGAASIDRRVPVCPVCGKPVPLKPGSDPNVAVDAHISRGCIDENFAKMAPARLACCVPGCRTTEVVPVCCSICGKNTCFKHRADMDHPCVKRVRQPQRSTPRESGIVRFFRKLFKKTSSSSSSSSSSY